MAAYASATLIKKYCKTLIVSDEDDADLTEAELLSYAENEDKLTLNPVLIKQYSLTDIQAAVGSSTENFMGEFVKTLSAKLGALAALKAAYSQNKQKSLEKNIADLEGDTSNALKMIKVGELRL